MKKSPEIQSPKRVQVQAAEISKSKIALLLVSAFFQLGRSNLHSSDVCSIPVKICKFNLFFGHQTSGKTRGREIQVQEWIFECKYSNKKFHQDIPLLHKELQFFP